MCVVVHAVVEDYAEVFVFFYELEVGVVECCCWWLVGLLFLFGDDHMLRLDGVEAHVVVFRPACHSIDRLLGVVVDDVAEDAVRKDVVCVLWVVCIQWQIGVDVLNVKKKEYRPQHTTLDNSCHYEFPERISIAALNSLFSVT